MEGMMVVKSLLALAFVLGLILLVAHLLRKYGSERLMARTPKSNAKRLSVVEVAMVDGRRRLVLVRRDDVEHLLLLSPTAETVVEAGISHVPEKTTWKVAE